MIFDWFKSREERLKEYDTVKPVPYISPSLATNEEQEQYSIGVTNDNRITLRVGYTTLTMNELGALNLIEQLELFANQLKKEKND